MHFLRPLGGGESHRYRVESLARDFETKISLPELSQIMLAPSGKPFSAALDPARPGMPRQVTRDLSFAGPLRSSDLSLHSSLSSHIFVQETKRLINSHLTYCGLPFYRLRVAQNRNERLLTFDFSLSQTSVDMTSGGLNIGTEYGNRGVALGHAQDGGNRGYKWVNALPIYRD